MKNIFNSLDKFKTINCNIPKWFLEAVDNSETDQLLNHEMPQEAREVFLRFISNISDLGVIGFGCRHFDNNGKTKLFTISKDWNKIKKDSRFKSCLKNYLVKELLSVSSNKQKLVTRSEDKIDDKYLEYLSNSSINNGVVFYRFDTKKIEVFYFVCAEVRIRDFVISNMSYINRLINEAFSSIKWIMESNLVSDAAIQILTKEQIKIIFSDTKYGDKTIIFKFNGGTISLSLCEIECLSYLQHGSSIAFIAKIIGRSPLTVRDKVNVLKEKLQVKSKKDLTCLANTELSQVLEQFEFNKNIYKVN